MDWPATLPAHDVLIAREQAAGARQGYVVYAGPLAPVVFESYVEAESHALRRAHETGGHVWYHDGGRFQMVVASIVHPGS